ncbi:hypothetical protein HGRIS_004152 [Hohenbuehelia grisea]|uniref:GATA-type domain-containing protein n=1 Tax=Hohenbuehelia grisea TaxID=104357 RepID=A0ABR3JHR8_9AGAR
MSPCSPSTVDDDPNIHPDLKQESIDPSLRTHNASPLPSPKDSHPMPHRVEALSMSAASSINTPPPRRSPPSHNPNLPPAMYHHSYSSDPQARSHQSSYPRPDPVQQTYYGSQAHYPRTDSHGFPDHAAYQLPPSNMASHHLTMPPVPPPNHSATMRDAYGMPYPLPGQTSLGITHTDDAATKLSDRVRRRCFNCCTTDTSTWRRSNLSPGKVLCNKCGLFERTHSRPRPEQFPHKRGPLASSALRPRSPPQQHHHLPPVQSHPHSLPPYHYTHPSIAPLSSSGTEPRRQYSGSSVASAQQQQQQQPTALPGVQAWLNEPPPAHATMQPPVTRRPTLESSPQLSRQGTPPLARSQQSQSQQQQPSAVEARDGPAAHD